MKIFFFFFLVFGASLYPFDCPHCQLKDNTTAAGPSSSSSAVCGSEEAYVDDDSDDDDDDDDDDLDIDELNELEASLSRTSIQIGEPSIAAS